MACEHTLKNYRTALWTPELFHEGRWQAWLDSGRKSPLDLAKERVRELFLRDGPEPVLGAETCRDVSKVVEEAEKALLGKTTGVVI